MLANNRIVPPEHLAGQIFPWVEEELDALQERQARNRDATDISAQKYLELLRFLRTVLLQDLAILHHQFPQSLVFSTKPFNSTAFRDFATAAPDHIRMAEQYRRRPWKMYPNTLPSEYGM